MNMTWWEEGDYRFHKIGQEDIPRKEWKKLLKWIKRKIMESNVCHFSFHLWLLRENTLYEVTWLGDDIVRIPTKYYDSVLNLVREEGFAFVHEKEANIKAVERVYDCYYISVIEDDGTFNERDFMVNGITWVEEHIGRTHLDRFIPNYIPSYRLRRYKKRLRRLKKIVGFIRNLLK